MMLRAKIVIRPKAPPASMSNMPRMPPAFCWKMSCSTYVPLPGIDPQVLQDIFQQNAGGILGMFDMLAGGALGRMTIFALNIMPYISASIIIQLLTAVSPRLEALKKEGEAGRKVLNQYTRYGTVLLAAVQAYGIAVGLEGFRGSAGSAGPDPGPFFPPTAGVTLAGGPTFFFW